MSETTLIDKLNKLGYTGTNSDELLSELPGVVWITNNDKQYKRREAFFALVIKKGKVHFTLSVQDEKDGEVYVLHEQVDSTPFVAICRMIFFIHANKMVEPEI